MELQNTNTNAFKIRIFKYLVDSTYDMDELGDSEKARAMLAKFEKEFNHVDNGKRYPTLQARVAAYLQGLPFNIAYSNYQIARDAEMLHGLPAESLSDKQEQQIVENWFNFCAFKLLQMWSHYGLTVKH